MKFSAIALFAIIISGCQPSTEVLTNKATKLEPQVSNAVTIPSLNIDITTPDRALKSYWQGKDAVSKFHKDWQANHIKEINDSKQKIGFDPKTLMTSDVLASQIERDKPNNFQHTEYSREILDIKQDTESHATVLVKIRNITPAPEGVTISVSDQASREEGKKLKYILEKETDGWKLAQIYTLDKYIDNGQWRQLLKADTFKSSVQTFIVEFEN